jgi:RHS repeat-associated protein
MRYGSVVALLACWLVGLAISPFAASGDGSSAGEVVANTSSLSGALVTPGSPSEGEQSRAAEQARLARPEAVAKREASLSEYEHLNTRQAEAVVAEAFPALIDAPADGPPKAPAGGRITSYTSDNTARVDLAGGKLGVIESSVPIATASRSGGYVPLNLALEEVGQAFAPKISSVGVDIPKSLSDGVSLGGSGVSLTPVNARGASLPTSGHLAAGMSVLYANALPDTDVVVKPTAQGFDEDALLRSVKSTQRLLFRVGLPQGASLLQEGSGPVRVVFASRVIALILPPSARDAAGTPVPVSMAVSGDTLSIAVSTRTGSYQYPIAVDPTVVSNEIFEKGAAWQFGTDNEHGFSLWGSGETWKEGEERKPSLLGVCLCGSGYARGQFGAVLYTTKGESKIERWRAESYSTIPSTVATSEILIADAHLESEKLLLPKEQGWHEVSATKEPSDGNTAEYLVTVTASSGTESYVSGFYRSEITLQQEAPPHVGMNTTEAVVNGDQNPLYGNRWASATSGGWGISTTGTDSGLGVQSSTSSSPSAAKWGSTIQGWCNGVQCHTPTTATFPLKGSTESLPEGEDSVEAKVKDPVGLEAATGSYKVKVDSAPPHNLTLTGLTNGGELGGGTTSLKVEATDGSGSTPSSGVKSIAVAVDGHEIGAPAGACSVPSGPCTATAEWPLSGGEFSTGEHKLKVTATDNAGNFATDEISFEVYRAALVPLGPGSIQPQSGELTLGATDVSVGGAGSSLGVTRSYRSRHLTAGSEGPLGPQWSLSVGGQESITRLPSGNATLTTANGGQTTFTSNEKGGFVSPTGDANLVLSEVKNEKGELTEYVLKDAAAAATTRFTSLTGPSGTLWKPTRQEGPLTSQTTRYIYQTVEGVTEPKYAIAPEPAGLSFSCIAKLEKAETLEKGCRVLEFRYAEQTRESIGEKESEWGEYKGRLQRVLVEAYNPASKKMEEPGIAVAEYAYDKQGRLRAEWNPQISPALKVLYGYDSEGHVTAVTAPGKESWAFTYGTIAGDSNAGRLLKATQAPVSASLWNGEPLSNTEAPQLSRQPVVGLQMSVSNGTWSSSPIVYGYQWEDCNSTGKACTPILGATNANYTPAASDIGHTLTAEVTAANGGGAIAAMSGYGKVLEAEMVEYTIPGTGYVFPRGIITGSDKNLWFTKFTSSESKIGKITTSGTITEYTLPSASQPEGITSGPDKNLWFTDEATSKVGKITTSGTVTEYALPAGSQPREITSGSDENLWFSEEGTSKIGKITTAGKITEYALPSGSRPVGIAAGSDKNLWFTDFGTSKVGKITTSGTVTEYALPSGSYPNAITAGPDANLWFTDNQTDEIGKITTAGTITEYSLPFASDPGSITAGPDKNLWFTDSNTKKIGKITTSGTITEYSLPEGGTQYGITSGPDGNVWYTNDSVTGRVGKLNLNPTQGAAIAPQPGWTVEYKVPLSGTGLTTLTKAEVEKWGQKDDPSEGMAIFPPDKPQGWPASGYERAAIDYMDSKGRTVNTVSPAGAVSTTEYNAYADVVRTLNPDNRLTALKETCESKLKCKSAELAKQLDTQRVYEESGSEPGARLLETLAPQRTVKLAKGKEKSNEEVLARSHVKYYYNEGAPSEGGPYDLVTRSTEGAQTPSKEEFDVRETKTAYSGQENLGWKLRKPTSVTLDPSGLNLTHTTAYEKETGEVAETRGPGGASEYSGTPVYASQFGTLGSGNGQLHLPRGIALDAKGDVLVADEENSRIDAFNEKGEYSKIIGSLGTGNGQFKEPRGVAIDSKGNIWVSDTSNYRLEEFNEKAEFIRALGWGVSNGEAKFEICTSACKAGIVGGGAGQFSDAKGIAIAPNNNVVVAEAGNNRVQEFTEKGEYLKVFGTPGSGSGQLKEPHGVSVAPNGAVWVADVLNNRVEVFKENGEWEKTVGAAGTGNGQFKEPRGVFVDTHGKVWVSDTENNRVEVFKENGEYAFQFGSLGSGNGQFHEPWAVVTDSHGDVFVSDGENNRVQRLTESSAKAHDTRTVYYSARPNEEYPQCGEHAEWANLPCQTQPAKQPETSGLPKLPVTVYKSYNMLDEPEKVAETVESTTRSKTTTYDAAGRMKTTAVSSTIGTALPIISDEYSSESGALTKQCANEGKPCSEGKPKTITSVYNTLGQLTSYTDASEATTTYEYEGEGSYKGAKELDGRLRHANDGKGTETYVYSESSGFLTELINEYGATKLPFTATYDSEGNMLTEGYPNGMTASYSYNATGTRTGLSYKKVTHCTEEKEKCIWFKDAIVPSIHGQWLEQTSSLSHQVYAYDDLGRLTQVQNTPAGKGCTTRLYTYDEETNRTSLTTREPNAKAECASEGGSEEKHTYDEANRLTDSGTAYNTFGDITALPAKDAGGKEPTEELTSTYYTDNQLASQTQGGETIGYNLDPAGRTVETVATGKKVADTTLHYAGPTSPPAWSTNTAGETVRDIPGINGQLAAIQSGTEAPELQVVNLHGDIVAKAYLSETATELASTADTSEFGVPTTSVPSKYSWLGALELPDELPSGVTNMGARSYVPQLGRFLQPDPIPGGSANAYSYTFGDPVNSFDPSGESTQSVLELDGGWAAEAGAVAQAKEEAEIAQRRAQEAANRAAEEAAARTVAEGEAWLATDEALMAGGGQYYGGGEEWEEWEEWEEEEWEYVSDKRGAGPAGEEAQLEAGVLVQPLGEEGTMSSAVSVGEGNKGDPVVPLCGVGAQGACAQDVRKYRMKAHSAAEAYCYTRANQYLAWAKKKSAEERWNAKNNKEWNEKSVGTAALGNMEEIYGGLE